MSDPQTVMEDFDTAHAQDIMDSIASGNLDAHLVQIEAALNERKAANGGSVHLYVGREIQLNELVRPKYLVYVPGVIVKVNKTTCVVDLREPVSKPNSYRVWHKGIKVPKSMIGRTAGDQSN
jgi:hypothetical protein